MGAIAFDAGDITVLGHKVTENITRKIGHKIGFMPQVTSLYPELTVKETIYFFANIHRINEKDRSDRFRMYQNLFELPPEDQKIECCSGGQQRRVSFCAAIIHDPELLILDEPTVGLDPLLREKIWNFLIHQTKARNLTTIISTHYIEETRNADCCGLMRNGVLLDEDSPRNLLEKYDCDTMEHAFLKLCNSQENNELNVEIDAEAETCSVENQKPELISFNIERNMSLTRKNALRLYRQPVLVEFKFLLMIIYSISEHFTFISFCIFRLCLSEEE